MVFDSELLFLEGDEMEIVGVGMAVFFLDGGFEGLVFDLQRLDPFLKTH